MTTQSATTTELPATTIVIPAYGDLPSLEASIQSVVAHGDLEHNRMLIINDIGPQAELIQARVLQLIEGLPNTEYVRNPKNLGFAATCNRAVFELDGTDNDILLLNSDAELTEGALAEMKAVLHLSEKHGVVCPRSNNATIATLPLMRRNKVIPIDLEHSKAVFARVKDELPRYTVSPVSIGFCFLVKRDLIRNYGLFDEIYSPGYSEENDFCLRINTVGYSAIIANHAYVVHEGSKSFTASSFDRNELAEQHEAIMVGRYPFYHSAVRHYLEYDIDPVDWFADYVGAEGSPKRVLIDLHHLSLIYDGSVRNALTFLTLLASRVAAGDFDDVEFVIASSKEAIAFFDLASFGFRAVDNDSVDEIFDLGFALAPVTDQAQILRLNRLCARWVLTHLDIIAARVLSLLENDIARKQVVRDSLRFADRVAVISEATRTDTLNYYPDLPQAISDKMTVVHQGAVENGTLASKQSASAYSARQRQAVKRGDYVLVIGNTFPHKQLPETMNVLRGIERTVVVFGSRADDQGDNIIPVAGGQLSDAELSELYERAAIIVYPSAYEGYGLPIAEAARHGKSVVLFDTQIAREVVAELGTQSSASYFSTFETLPEVLEAAIARSAEVTHGEIRTLDDYNSDLIDIVIDELMKPVDLPKLRERMQHFRAIQSYLEKPVERGNGLQYHLDRVLQRRSFRIVDQVVVRAGFLRPVLRQVNTLRRRLRR